MEVHIYELQIFLVEFAVDDNEDNNQVGEGALWQGTRDREMDLFLSLVKSRVNFSSFAYILH